VRKKNHWICSLPATFMTAVSVTFMLQAKIGFNLSPKISLIAGIAVALICLILFLIKFRKSENPEDAAELESAIE
jgi:carbon starvation protein CstA